MTTQDPEKPRLASLRPLVRYVDESQAVIDVHVRLQPPQDPAAAELDKTPIDLLIEMRGPDDTGFEYQRSLSVHDGAGMVRFVVPDPQRWWPAGMGEQWLYDLAVTLRRGGQVLDIWRTTLGLASVRTEASPDAGAGPVLLIHGQPYRFRSVTAVNPDDESKLLPVSHQSLLVVRGHLAPRKLFEAADRAGVLIIQSLPAPALAEDGAWREPGDDSPDPAESPEASPTDQAALTPMPDLAPVDELTAHPSLAGWFVGHADAMTERIIRRIHDLDPTRSVFRQLPHGQRRGGL
jgi:hypothetical protein